MQIIGVVLFALSLRFLGIRTRPIWYDEAFSILFSTKGIDAMLSGTLSQTGGGSADIHPLGYYSLLWVWMKLFGESLFFTRLLSIFAGLGIILLIYLIARYLFKEKTAFWAILFVVVSPFQIHYGQEVRMYAFLALWLLLATYAFLKGIKDSNWKWIFLFSLASAFAQYTHNLAFCFLVPLALTPFFIKDLKMIFRTAVAGGFALLIYLPWLIHLPSQFSKVQTSYWIEKPDFSRIITLLFSYVTNLPLPDNWLFPALLFTFFLISIALWQTFLSLKKKETQAWRGAWLLYLTFMPPLLLFGVSQWVPVFIERAFVASGAVFCLWLAWAIFETKLPKVILSVSVIFFFLGASMGIYQHLNYIGFPYAPYREMTVYLESQKEASDVIIHSNKLTAFPAIYYAPNLSQEYLADPKGSGADTLALATQETLGLFAKPNLEEATMNADRVWFVVFQKAIDEYKDVGFSTHPHLKWLNERYTLEKIESWEDVRIYLFSKNDDK